jgi:hypothetical protein
MTIADMAARVATLEAQVNEDLQHVKHLQYVARRDKDVIKLGCVNDKLVELNAEMNIFDTEKGQFQAGLAGQPADEQPIYAEAAKEGEKVHRLRKDADGCAGVPELYKQESGLGVEHPPLPDDPTVPPIFGEPVNYGTILEPPGYASPFS